MSPVPRLAEWFGVARQPPQTVLALLRHTASSLNKAKRMKRFIATLSRGSAVNRSVAGKARMSRWCPWKQAFRSVCLPPPQWLVCDEWLRASCAKGKRGRPHTSRIHPKVSRHFFKRVKNMRCCGVFPPSPATPSIGGRKVSKQIIKRTPGRCQMREGSEQRKWVPVREQEEKEKEIDNDRV